MGALLLEAFNWFDRSLLISLTRMGWPKLSHSQSLVMAYVTNDRAGIRISELARRLGISRQATHKGVRELERLRFVTITPDPTNSIARIVRLTERGELIVTDAIRVFGKIEAELCHRIGKDSLASMRSALEKDWGIPIRVAAGRVT